MWENGEDIEEEFSIFRLKFSANPTEGPLE